jgi:outer membrane protein assembly factor BamB
MAPVLSTLSGTKVLYIGQKSGNVWCINALTGATIWSTQTSPGGTLGGLSWGISVDDTKVYGSVINYLNQAWTLKNNTIVYGGGWVALDKITGSIVWTTANPANFDPTGLPSNPSSNGRSTTSWGSGPAVSVGDILLVTSADSVYSPNVYSGSPIYGSGGYVYVLKKTDGSILSSYETKAGIYGGFSADTRCAFVGFGYSFLSQGKGVYGWCI